MTDDEMCWCGHPEDAHYVGPDPLGFSDLEFAFCEACPTATTAYMHYFETQRDADLHLIARHVIAAAAYDRTEDGWDLYPELGEADWENVVALVAELAPFPDQDRYLAAYKRRAAACREWAAQHPEAAL